MLAYIAYMDPMGKSWLTMDSAMACLIFESSRLWYFGRLPVGRPLERSMEYVYPLVNVYIANWKITIFQWVNPL